MSIELPPRLPDPWAPWFDPQTGKPTQIFYDYLRESDQAMRALIAMTTPVAYTDLPTGTEGDLAYVSDGRKAGEGAGNGTGVLAFKDASDWIAVDTGAAVDD